MFSRDLFKLWTMKSKWNKERSEATKGQIRGNKKVSGLKVPKISKNRYERSS